MRCYNLNNSYMESIQSGLQSAHAQHELCKKYLSPRFSNTTGHDDPDKTIYDLEEWLEYHKTIIILNGGWQKSLEGMIEFLSSSREHTYAWTELREEKDSINDALTNVALVLPHHMYAYSRYIAPFLGKKLPSENVAFEPDEFDDTGVPVNITMTLHENKTLSLADHILDKSFEYTFYDLRLIKRLSKMSLM